MRIIECARGPVGFHQLSADAPLLSTAESALGRVRGSSQTGFFSELRQVATAFGTKSIWPQRRARCSAPGRFFLIVGVRAVQVAAHPFEQFLAYWRGSFCGDRGGAGTEKTEVSNSGDSAVSALFQLGPRREEPSQAKSRASAARNFCSAEGCRSRRGDADPNLRLRWPPSSRLFGNGHTITPVRVLYKRGCGVLKGQRFC